MNLSEIIDNSRSDKNTVHSYLGLYQNLLVNKKYSAKNVLEIGIHEGGSIKMWYDFFPNAMIYGLDIIQIKKVWNEILNKDRIRLGRFDAYNETFVNHFLSKNIQFDFILYDGPNNLEYMKKFIQLYTRLMTDDGILIIEDVQDLSWIEILKNEVPENLKNFINSYDLRENKNRYDDIVFTIDKMNVKEPVVVVEEEPAVVVVEEDPVVVVVEEEPAVVVVEEEPAVVVEEEPAVVVVEEEPVVVVVEEEPVGVVVEEEPVVVVVEEEPVVVVVEEEPAVVVVEEEPAVVVVEEEPVVVVVEEEPAVVVVKEQVM